MFALALLVVVAPGAGDLPAAATATAAQPQALPHKAMNMYALLPERALPAELRRRHAQGGRWPVLIERVTRGFVGAPYLLSALGEGSPPDADPRFRVDAFDCTTFVETAMALVRNDEWKAAAAELDEIRYESAPAFQARRHLMIAQWIPDLQARGYLADITIDVGGKAAQTASLNLTPARWKRRRIAKSLRLDDVPYGKFSLPIIPIDVVLKRAKSIPPGTIINVVRVDVPYAPVRVTHQGIVLVPKGGKSIRIVRHASPVSKRVIDEPLTRMMTRYLKPRKWPIAGVNLQRIVDPAEN